MDRDKFGGIMKVKGLHMGIVDTEEDTADDLFKDKPFIQMLKIIAIFFVAGLLSFCGIIYFTIWCLNHFGIIGN